MLRKNELHTVRQIMIPFLQKWIPWIPWTLLLLVLAPLEEYHIIIWDESGFSIICRLEPARFHWGIHVGEVRPLREAQLVTVLRLTGKQGFSLSSRCGLGNHKTLKDCCPGGHNRSWSLVAIAGWGVSSVFHRLFRRKLRQMEGLETVSLTAWHQALNRAVTASETFRNVEWSERRAGGQTVSFFPMILQCLSYGSLEDLWSRRASITWTRA